MSAQEKQIEVLSSFSLTLGPKTSHSFSLALTLDYLFFLAICVSFVCLSLPMRKSKGHLKLFSFHIASLWRTTFDFGHSNHVLMCCVFSCWFFAYAKLKEELCCPWRSKSSWLVLIFAFSQGEHSIDKHQISCSIASVLFHYCGHCGLYHQCCMW